MTFQDAEKVLFVVEGILSHAVSLAWKQTAIKINRNRKCEGGVKGCIERKGKERSKPQLIRNSGLDQRLNERRCVRKVNTAKRKH